MILYAVVVCVIFHLSLAECICTILISIFITFSLCLSLFVSVSVSLSFALTSWTNPFKYFDELQSMQEAESGLGVRFFLF